MKQAERFEVGVAGVTFESRQVLLQALYAAQEDGHPLLAALVREPGNAYDRNAIRVEIEADEGPVAVGYVPRTLASTLAPRMDRGERACVVSARIVRGGEAPRQMYGARIDVEMKEAV